MPNVVEVVYYTSKNTSVQAIMLNTQMSFFIVSVLNLCRLRIVKVSSDLHKTTLYINHSIDTVKHLTTDVITGFFRLTTTFLQIRLLDYENLCISM